MACCPFLATVVETDKEGGAATEMDIGDAAKRFRLASNALSVSGIGPWVTAAPADAVRTPLTSPLARAPKLAVTPCGNPAIENVGEPAYPFRAFSVAAKDVAPPCVTVTGPDDDMV